VVRTAHNRISRLAWVPAFAGMSGIKKMCLWLFFSPEGPLFQFFHRVDQAGDVLGAGEAVVAFSDEGED
jgi:hypothetical protein